MMHGRYVIKVDLHCENVVSNDSKQTANIIQG